MLGLPGCGSGVPALGTCWNDPWVDTCRFCTGKGGSVASHGCAPDTSQTDTRRVPCASSVVCPCTFWAPRDCSGNFHIGHPRCPDGGMSQALFMFPFAPVFFMLLSVILRFALTSPVGSSDQTPCACAVPPRLLHTVDCSGELLCWGLPTPLQLGLGTA